MKDPCSSYNPPSVAGIILAAGRSSRMGQDKLTLDLAGVPVIRRVILAVLGSKLFKVVLVVPEAHERLLRAAGELPRGDRLGLAVNPAPERGLSSSLKTGLESVGMATVGMMFILGDQPMITSAVIDAMINAFALDCSKIVVPVVNGRRSNPVVFPAAMTRELMLVTGDEGGRSVLKRNQNMVVTITMDSMYDDSDVDTPEDLSRIRDSIQPGPTKQS